MAHDRERELRLEIVPPRRVGLLGLAVGDVVEDVWCEAALRVPRARRRAPLEMRRVLERAGVEARGRPRGDGGVHAVLRREHPYGVLGCLQPLEQRLLVVVLDGGLGEDGGWQLRRISN